MEEEGERGADRVASASKSTGMASGRVTYVEARCGCPDTTLLADNRGLCDLAAANEVAIDVCCGCHSMSILFQSNLRTDEAKLTLPRHV
jgi:hypothetical protein